MPTTQELIKKNITLVSLPEIVNRINMLINDPNATASDIAQLISQDPALTTQLLKVVNSPLYPLSRPVESILAAVSLLGSRQIRDLVIAQTIIKRFKKGIETGFELEAFWCHSITAGIAARVIATELRLNNTERFFIAGLLHDIGKMVMALLLPKESQQLRKLLSRSISKNNEIEVNVMGFTHADLGAELLRHWNFPDSLVEASAYHHQPDHAHKFHQEASIVHIANVIANNLQSPISRDDDTLLQPGLLQEMGITQIMFESFHEQVYLQLDNVLQVLYYELAA